MTEAEPVYCPCCGQVVVVPSTSLPVDDALLADAGEWLMQRMTRHE